MIREIPADFTSPIILWEETEELVDDSWPTGTFPISATGFRVDFAGEYSEKVNVFWSSVSSQTHGIVVQGIDQASTPRDVTSPFDPTQVLLADQRQRPTRLMFSA